MKISSRDELTNNHVHTCIKKPNVNKLTQETWKTEEFMHKEIETIQQIEIMHNLKVL